MWHSARLVFPHNHFIKGHGCNHICISYIYISHTDILYSNMSKLTFLFWLCCDCILYMSSWFPEKIKTIAVMSSYHVARFCKRLYGMIVCTICPVHCFAWLNANLRIWSYTQDSSMPSFNLKVAGNDHSNIKHLQTYVYIYIYVCINTYIHIWTYIHIT